MTVIKALIENLYPFYSSAVLAGAALITIFFGLSNKKGIKIFVVLVAGFAITGSLFLSIFISPQAVNFSDYLFNFSYLSIIQTVLVLFAALNILILVSLNNFENRQFTKVIIIFLFSLTCLSMFIISTNLLMVFASFILSVISIFQTISLLNNDNNIRSFSEYSLKNNLLSVILTIVFALLLIFVGYSLIFGATDFKNYTQILQSDKIDNTLVRSGLILIMSSAFFYLFLFPFQNAYLKFGRRSESSSNLIIWFLYFPAAVFMFLKTFDTFLFFMDKNIPAMSVVLIASSLLCIIGGNIGAIKTTSLRRILLFLFLSMIGMTVLALAQRSLMLILDSRATWLIIANFVVTGIFYFPAYALFSVIEKQAGSDSLAGIAGLARKNKLLGTTLIILLLSFGGMIGTSGYLTKVYYIQPYFERLSNIGAGTPESNRYLVISAAVISIIALLFIAANVIRLTAVILKKPAPGEKTIIFPKVYYYYLCFFVLLSLFIGITGLLVIIGPTGGYAGLDLINIF